MRIILDTYKKTITVPWNYTYKLEEMNKMIMEISGDESKKRLSADISMNAGSMP